MNGLSAEEIAVLDRHLEWQSNPCGKPKLDLSALHRFPEWLPDNPALGVDSPHEPNRADRKAMLTNLEGAYHWNKDFPFDLRGYYEGPYPGSSAWVIIIYGGKKKARPLPEPWIPAFMR